MKNRTNDNKPRVLHVITTLKRGGAQKFLMTLIRSTNDDYINTVVYYYGGYYNSFDILAIPSKSEGFPYISLEAADLTKALFNRKFPAPSQFER